MLIDKFPVGVHSGFYVGMVGDTVPLTRLRTTRTKGLEIQDVTPAEYVTYLKRFCQTDIRRVELTANFYCDNAVVYKIAGSINATGGDLNDTPDLSNLYTVFIVDTVSGSEKSYIIHEANAISNGVVKRGANYNKDAATIISITFTGYDKDDSNYTPLSKGLAVPLGTSLGAQNPLA